MEKEFQPRYSVDDIRKLLDGPDDDIIETTKMSKFVDGKLIPKTYYLRRGEVRSALRSVSKDQVLIDQTLSETRRLRARIKAGEDIPRIAANPLLEPTVAHYSADRSSKTAFTPFLFNVLGSYVLLKYGNKEELDV